MIRSGSRVAIPLTRASTRAMSSELSVEELKEAVTKVERHKKHVQKSALPTTMTGVTGPGVELHVPKDLTEMASLMRFGSKAVAGALAPEASRSPLWKTASEKVRRMESPDPVMGSAVASGAVKS